MIPLYTLVEVVGVPGRGTAGSRMFVSNIQQIHKHGKLKYVYDLNPCVTWIKALQEALAEPRSPGGRGDAIRYSVGKLSGTYDGDDLKVIVDASTVIAEMDSELIFVGECFEQDYERVRRHL